MAITEYEYSISTTTLHGTLNLDKLTIEVQASSIVTALDHMISSGDSFSVFFKDALSAGDVTTLDGVLAAHDGYALPEAPEYKIDADGVQLTAPAPRLGSGKTIISHNFCDRLSWYEESIKEDGGDGYGKALTNSGNELTWTSPDAYWIDLTHGRITGEDAITGYEVSLTVNGVDGYAEDTDYTVDYTAGKVTFASALQSGDTVKAIYNHENGSTFTLAPAANKKLRILYTEVQFGVTSQITSPIVFQVYVYNPQDLPNKIPYGTPEVYKNAKDLVNVSNGGASIQKFADLVEDIVILPFNYATVKDLSSSVGAEIRISLANDIELDGYYGTITAYNLSEDE